VISRSAPGATSPSLPGARSLVNSLSLISQLVLRLGFDQIMVQADQLHFVQSSLDVRFTHPPLHLDHLDLVSDLDLLGQKLCLVRSTLRDFDKCSRHNIPLSPRCQIPSSLLRRLSLSYFPISSSRGRAPHHAGWDGCPSYCRTPDAAPPKILGKLRH
jgi:hypothetical protein